MVPGIPTIVPQRGNRRLRTFFKDEDYRWSSVHAHLTGRGDGVVNAKALRDRVGDWREFLKEGLEKADFERLRGHEKTGRPAGSEAFIEELETRLARSLKKQKPGPKPREK